jgi:hypothetical protein
MIRWLVKAYIVNFEIKKLIKVYLVCLKVVVLLMHNLIGTVHKKLKFLNNIYIK